MVKPSTSPTQTPQKAQMALRQQHFKAVITTTLLPSIPRSHSHSLIDPSSIARAMTMHPNASHWNSQGMISQALIPLKLGTVSLSSQIQKGKIPYQLLQSATASLPMEES